MSTAKPVSVTIMDKEYLIACEEGEREQLHAAVRMLNEKCAEARNSGNVIGTERIAVMAALHLAHELIDHKNQNQDYTSKVDDNVRRLRQKIEEALSRAPA